MSKKYVYMFSEGNAGMRNLLGGKGANLAEMTNIGLPVPPGFTVTTKTCAEFNEAGEKFPAGLMDDVRKNVKLLEKESGKRFGSSDNPLLVSVRSGAAASMPGMMDTVLNLGLNDDACEGLAHTSGNPRFALDAYRRLINMFANVVMGVPSVLRATVRLRLSIRTHHAGRACQLCQVVIITARPNRPRRCVPPVFHPRQPPQSVCFAVKADDDTWRIRGKRED